MDNNGQSSVPAEQTVESANDVTIDLGRIFRALLHYIWVIVIAIVLGAAIMFGYTKLFVTEMYTTSITIYVSQKSEVSSSDSYVANVVAPLIKDHDTIADAVDYANETYGEAYGKTFTYGMISGSISTSVGTAGLLYLTVEYSEPQAAAYIANSVYAVLKPRVDEVYSGDYTVEKFSDAQVPSSPSSPNTTKNVLIGAVAGAAVAVVVIVLIELLNNKIYDNDYLLSTYNIPILAEIPDFAAKNKSKKYYSSYGYGYGAKKT